MRPDGLLSATDLANHLACRHLTELDRAVAEGRLDAPAGFDPALALLAQRGAAHERAFVAHLVAAGLSVTELGDDGKDGAGAQRTLSAMRTGADVLVQAPLGEGTWRGRADLLLRVEEPSDLGPWSYEAADTKLAQETRGATALQLCLYTDLVGRLQGRAPSRMHVVKPGDAFPRETFLYADFEAYYRFVSRRLARAVAAPPSEATYPDPVEHCEICRWRLECDARRHTDDHLSLVAGIRSLHVGEIRRQGVHTLREFADAAQPLREKPLRGSPQAFEKAHGQARAQLAGRRQGRLVYDLLPAEPGAGLARLPDPCAGDLFFDIESDPFVPGGGLEYLLGVALAQGAPAYRAFWGLGAEAERRAFEAFVDLVMERWRADAGMHVYHFSPYEPAALKRLAGRHGTREAELDRLLRGQRLVDLLAVTRRGLRASVESYSLKELERFCGFRRSVDLRAAGGALRRVAAALELGGQVQAEDREVVAGYNRDDCLSTAALRRWLEERRAELVAGGAEVQRPALLSGDASEAVQERATETRELYERLVAGLPDDRSAWGRDEKALWLLAHQLDYFRREENCAWWEYHRIRELEPEELLEERKAVAGLELVGVVDGGKARYPVHRYRFPPQEAALAEGDELHVPGADMSGAIGVVHAIDHARRTLDIRKRAGAAALHPSAVMVNEVVRSRPIDGAFVSLARSIAERGVDGDGPYRAARDLLVRRPPRLRTRAGTALRHGGEDVVHAAVRLVLDLDHGVLPIQGPPGTGKTYAGARMIVALAAAGRRVGVTAVSHKVIRNLLEEAGRAAEEQGVPLRLAHRVKEPSAGAEQGIEELTDNPKALAAVEAGKVVGGTVWLWARDEMDQRLDTLFVDEAGQMSLAHALAAARSARNLVLLGDPQQLEQPQRGAHPEGSEVAALVHVLDGRPTISDEAGLFLDETWRLHPRICSFTSQLYYESRLRARPGLELQELSGDTPFAGSGLFYVPVEHAGNQNSSLEEVETVSRIVEGLLVPGVSWRDRKGIVQAIGIDDILVVAPYNAQVGALTGRLPAASRIGTVDRFQGQQAPVVIYSMASSSAGDAPRGMGFLYDPHRLNVASSRARCVCILVASPALLEPDCRTTDEMKWANGLCRFRELATEVAPIAASPRGDRAARG